MRLYDNAPSSSYEELKKFYPVFYQDVLEMDALWRVFGDELDSFRSGIVSAINNCFINKADEIALGKLEKFLFISYNGPRTLEERRTMIASFFLGNGHIGEKEIKEIICAFTAGDISVELNGGTIEISVTRELSDRFNLSDCLFILVKRLPSHLGVAFHDILLPIRFLNKETFLYRTFIVQNQFRVNGEAQLVYLLIRSTYFTPTGSELPSVAFLLSITANHTNNTFVAFTASTGVLNGNIFLNTASRFSLLVQQHEHLFGLPVLSFFYPPIPNEARNAFLVFEVSVEARNNIQFLDAHTRFSLRAKQQFTLSGSIVIDRMYRLNGSTRLDGTRKLNASIVKEEI